MASVAPSQEALLNLLARPLGRRELVLLGFAGVAAMLAYCISHELVRGFSFDLVPATFWALGGVLPLILAYDLLNRLPDRRIFDNRQALLLTLVASAGAVALSTGLTWLNATLFFGEAGSVAAIALARVPLMLFLVGASFVSIRAGRLARGFQPSWQTSSGEPLAIVETKLATDPGLSFPSPEPERKISLRLQDGHFIPDLSLVSSVTAAANYAEIRVGARVILTRVTMAELEAQLGGHGFRRIHRSTIVNSALVQSVVPRGKKLAVNLATGERFQVGPSYRDKIIPA